MILVIKERLPFSFDLKQHPRLYEAPQNLALAGKSCRLSTLYKDKEGLSALNAIDGNLDGMKKSLSTQPI